VRCQYCGKNLWPLRGLFDEDFCSRDHRQRYHERVRKALEHMPTVEPTARPSAVAGFRFEKPALQENPTKSRGPVEVIKQRPTPSLPDFAPAAASPELRPAPFSFASPDAARGATAHQKFEVTAGAFAQNIVTIDRLRDRVGFAQRKAIAPLVDSPAPVLLRPGDYRAQVTRSGRIALEAFEELTHVYLHEPELRMESGFPVGDSFAEQLKPIAGSITKPVSETRLAGAAHIEYFPGPPISAVAIQASANPEDMLPEMAFQVGQHIWLEDPMTWRFSVNLGSEHNVEASLRVSAQPAPLAQTINAFPARATSAEPVAWQFGPVNAGRSVLQHSGMPRSTSAAVLEFPAARARSAQPQFGSTALFTVDNFALYVPELSAECDTLLEATEAAEIAPAEAKAFGSESKNGEAFLPRAAGWVPMEARAAAPASSIPLHNGNATPNNRAASLNLPDRAVRLINGPSFFAAEPLIANSAACPVMSRTAEFSSSLNLPACATFESDLSFRPMASQPLLPAQSSIESAAATDRAQAVVTTEIRIPDLQAQTAGFAQALLKQMEFRVMDTGDRLPHRFDVMDPKLALHLPEMHYEEYPLALKISVPEPRMVTVFETATVDPQGKVLPITQSRTKRFAVPSYLKGMAAGIMLASFLWFGSSSMKSDGITLRPGDLIRMTIQRRAVYEVGDNFHAGLASWDGGKGLSKSWVYDREGYVRPGRMALYKPSMDMKDYKLEFLTQIERKSVGWVFRAVDEQNYYAMKLAVTEPGPRPIVALVRYQVVDGKRESRGETPLQVMMHNNRPYRVQVDVKGNHFLTSIEGQLVDSWSDDRFKTGGVGFFTESSEKARLYWMKVTKNSDLLGKLCSILVPKES